MSEIRATTISDSAGTGPITLTGQVPAKMWVRYNGSSVVSDSFNVSSTTDSATTGRTDIAFTNNMAASDSYAAVSTCNGTSSDRFVTASNMAATGFTTYSFDGATRTDLPIGTVAIGDLA